MLLIQKDLPSLAMESIMLLRHKFFDEYEVGQDQKIVCKKICTLHVKQVILLPLAFRGWPPKEDLWSWRIIKTYLKSPISTVTVHRTSKPERVQPSKEYFLCLGATNTEHDIAQNTKTTDNTGINKHSKYKAFRHTIYQSIIQIQEQWI